MFSFYIFLEKPLFLSLGEVVEVKLEIRNVLLLCSKLQLKNIQEILSIQKHGHLLAQTMNVL